MTRIKNFCTGKKPRKSSSFASTSVSYRTFRSVKKIENYNVASFAC